MYGLLLISPFPISLLAALILQMLFGEEGSLYAIIAEMIITVVITIAALIIVWIVYKPIDEEPDVPDEFLPRV
ncbi:MAG: hypothetical protein P8Y98_03705 [Anaerolineales bacterium]